MAARPAASAHIVRRVRHSLVVAAPVLVRSDNGVYYRSAARVRDVSTTTEGDIMNTIAIRGLAATAVIAGTLGAFAAPASASHGGGGGVQNSGSCVGGGTFKLKAKHDDGRIEVEYEVDTNRAGQLWHVRLTDNGTTIFQGTRTTKAPSGSFDINKMTANRSGADMIRAHATFRARSCGGHVSV